MCLLCTTFNPAVRDCEYVGLVPDVGEGITTVEADVSQVATPDTGTNALTLNETTDAPDDPADAGTTPYVLSVGDTFNGEISVDGDVDIIALNVEAGVTYTFTMTPGTMDDPYFEAYDDDGTLLAVWDQGFGGEAETLSLTATEDGVVYVGLTSYYNSADGLANFPSVVDTGTYSVTFEEFVYADNSPVDAITWDYTAPSTINVYFVPPATAIEETFFGSTYNSTEWSAADLANAAAAFALFESVANLNFNIVTDASQADFFMIESSDAFSSPNSLGYWAIGGGSLEVAGTTYSTDGWGVFNSDSSSWTDGTNQGSYGFVTLVHEIAHGLGLAHPHDGGGGSDLIPDVVSPFGLPGLFDLNQGVFTTMSYNTGWIESPNGTPFTNLYGFEGTPMALDIAVLQEKYGANLTTATGDDTYQLADVNGVGTFYAAIWDAAGTDAITYSGSANAMIDLRAATLEYEVGGGGFVSYVDGILGGFTIANGVVIENAFGGAGNDTIMGNDAANSLTGGGGTDSMDGGAGADSMFGGLGDDTMNGDGEFDYMEGGDGRDSMAGGMGNDTLLGGNQNDRMSGGNGDDFILGEMGNDTLIGGRGDDTMNGGNRKDKLFGGKGEDVLYGGAGDDVLRGGAQSDYLDGGTGNDSLVGGAGFDTLIGGEGDDSMTGSFNADRFIFVDGHGSDVITDFEATNDFEKIDFSGLSSINSMDDIFGTSTITAKATQVGNDVVFDTDGGTITLESVLLSDLDALDFIF